MTEFNPGSSKRRLEPGLTKICKLKMRDSEGNVIEHDLYYGNVIYMNNLACSVKTELYEAKLSAFLKSSIGMDFERPTTDDIKDAYKEARRPDILAQHKSKSGVITEKKHEKKTDKSSLMNIVKGNMFTPEMEKKKREEDANKGKTNGDGLSLNRLVDEQLKVEHQKQQIEDEKKRLEQERLDSMKAKKELESEMERHAQMVQEEKERLEAKKEEEQKASEKIAEIQKQNEEQLSVIEEQRKKLVEEKASLAAEQEKMAAERIRHQALIDSLPALEKKKDELIEKEKRVHLAEQSILNQKKECDRLVEEATNEKNRLRTEFDNLNEEKNEFEEQRKKLVEEKTSLAAEQEKMAAERIRHQALIDSLPALEKKKDELIEKEKRVHLAEQSVLNQKKECDRLVEEATNEKNRLRTESDNLNEEKNEFEEQKQKLLNEINTFETEKKEKGEELNSAFERLNEEKKQFEQSKKDYAKKARLEEINAKAKKNYTARMSTAVGITTASVLGCAFMGLSLYGIIPGMNPAAKAGSSVLNVVSMKNNVNAGDVITAEDIEMVAITADQYSSMTGGKVLKADGTSVDNYVVLWNNVNDVIGSYATDNLGQGEYLMTAEYSELKDGDAYVTMILDGVETKIPVSVTTAGTSSVKFYAIVTTADENGESRNLAIDMGALALEGRSLVDAIDSDGKSVIDEITSDKQGTTETTPDDEPESMPESGETTEEK